MIRGIAFIVGITRKHDKLLRKLIEIYVIDQNDFCVSFVNL